MNRNILLVISLLPWLLAGGGLIYLSPAIADAITHSKMTGTWMVTLQRGGYYPGLAAGVSIVMIILGIILAIVQAKVDGKPLFSIPQKP